MFERFNGNVVPFADESTSTNRTVFGSETQSDDIDDNLNADFKKGWEIVGLNDNPTREDFNAMGYTLGYLTSYLYQNGVAEYNLLQEYKNNSIAIGTDGNIYQSLVDNNIGNALTDTTKWVCIASKNSIVNSIDELKTISNIESINVLGYYEKGDGGGGTFYWDATSTESDNEGTIIQATGVTTGRWKRVFSGAVNVKWFGAKGDGVTDDTIAIQNAIDFTPDKGTLLLDTGAYKTVSTLYTKRSINFVGNGRHSLMTGYYSHYAQIFSSADVVIEASPDLSFSTQPPFTESQVVIDNIAFRGNRSNICINTHYSAAYEIKNCHINSFDIGIGVNGSWGLNIDRNVITDCNKAVCGDASDARLGYTTYEGTVKFFQVNSLNITRNDINNAIFGIYLYICANNVNINGNTLQTCTDSAIALGSFNGEAYGKVPSVYSTEYPDLYTRMYGVNIKENYFEKNGEYQTSNGVHIKVGISNATYNYAYQNNYGIIVENNQFNIDACKYSIEINNMEQSSITNNTFRNAVRPDFYVANTTTIQNNRIDVVQSYIGYFTLGKKNILHYVKELPYEYARRIDIDINSTYTGHQVTTYNGGSGYAFKYLSDAIAFINEFRYLINNNNNEIVIRFISAGDYTSTGVATMPKNLNYVITDTGSIATDGVVVRGFSFTNSKVRWSSNYGIKISATTSSGIYVYNSSITIYRANIVSTAGNTKYGFEASGASTMLISGGNTVSADFTRTISSDGSIVLNAAGLTNTITSSAGQIYP